MSVAGCGGYFPLRRPSADLWTPSTPPRPPIHAPSSALEEYPERARQAGLSGAIQIISRAQAKTIFHADLLGHGVQPLAMVLHNDGQETYAFTASQMSMRALPASQVARYAYVHPAITTVRLATWLVMFVPGLVMESIIEPATTLDFPNFENAARRPTLPHRRDIQAEFLQQEIPNGLLAPQSTLAGYLFVHPLPLGRPVQVTLMNVQTQQPLVLALPTPLPVYADQRAYAHPVGGVWAAVVEVAGTIPSWRVTRQEPEQGVLLLRKGVTWWRWLTATTITVTVKAVDARTTRVMLESPLARADSAAYGAHSKTIDRFFEALDTRFPSQAPMLTAPAVSSRPSADVSKRAPASPPTSYEQR